MKTFSQFSRNRDHSFGDDTGDISESALISPTVAKAGTVGILLKMKTLSGQVSQLKGPDTKALTAISDQLLLLGSMLALAIGTIEYDTANGGRR